MAAPSFVSSGVVGFTKWNRETETEPEHFFSGGETTTSIVSGAEKIRDILDVMRGLRGAVGWADFSATFIFFRKDQENKGPNHNYAVVLPASVRKFEPVTIKDVTDAMTVRAYLNCTKEGVPTRSKLEACVLNQFSRAEHTLM